MSKPVDVFAPMVEAYELIRTHFSDMLPLIGTVTALSFVLQAVGVSSTLARYYAGQEVQLTLQVVSNLLNLVVLPLNVYLTIGLYRVGLAAVRGEPVVMDLAVTTPRHFARVFFLGASAYVLGMVMFCCCLGVPGVIWYVLMYPMVVLASDHERPGFTQFDDAIRIASPHFPMLFVQMLVVFLVAIIGSLVTLLLGTGLIQVWAAFVAAITTEAMRKAAASTEP